MRTKYSYTYTASIAGSYIAPLWPLLHQKASSHNKVINKGKYYLPTLCDLRLLSARPRVLGSSATVQKKVMLIIIYSK